MSLPRSLARLVPLVVGVAALAATKPGWAGSALPARRVEVRLTTTTKRPRVFQVTPGEWVLCSSRQGLWLPYLDPSRNDLAFQKHGACIVDVVDGAEGALLGVRLGTQTGRPEVRSAVRSGVSPLTIWCAEEKGVEEIPPLEAGRYYALSVGTVSSLEAVGRLRHLSALRVTCGTGVTDLSPLAKLTGLESLWLGCRGVTDLSPLAQLADLRVLHLYAGEGIADLSPLARLKKLRVLVVRDAWAVTDLSPLASLAELGTLELRGGRSLTDLSPLAHLTNLTWLDLRDSPRLSDLSALRRLTHLTHLDLSQCPLVGDLSPLADLVELDYLDLHAAAPVRDVAPLARMTKLKHLDLLGCHQIADLWPMRRMLQTLPPHVAVEGPLRQQLLTAQSGRPSTITITTNGQHVTSVDPALDFPDDPCRWVNILARGVKPPAEFTGCTDRLLFPVAGRPAGQILRFTWEGPNVWLSEDGGPRRLAGIVATRPSGRVALRDAVARKISPLIVWADADSLDMLAHLPDRCGVTLVLMGLGAPLKPLANVRNLSGLHILSCGSPVSDLGDLRRLTCLHTLDLPTGPRIKSVDRLATMTHLTALNITLSDRVTDLAPLAKLANLETLQLTCSVPPDLAPLGCLPKLRALGLEGTTDGRPLTGLDRLTRLETLTLQWRGRTADFQALAALPRLKALHLIDCTQLTDLAAIARLPNLEVLTLRDCDRIRDLTPVATLPKLRTFRLDFCDGLTSLAPLQHLESRGVRLALDTQLRRRLAAAHD